MAIIFKCDGCGTLDDGIPATALRGRIDDEDVLWCHDCTKAARAAVAARSAGPRTGEDRIREAMTEAQENPGKLITA